MLKEKLVELIKKSGACFECFPVAGYEKTEIEKIADYLIANGVTVLKWTSVDKELPKKDGKYLVAIKHGSGYSISTRKFRKDISHWTIGHGHWARNTGGVRYWAELPAPPKED